MKNVTTHRGTLEVVQRLPSSANGNPRYLVRVDGWTCRTAVDSQIAYGITNLDGKVVDATIGTFRGVAMLGDARIADCDPYSPQLPPDWAILEAMES